MVKRLKIKFQVIECVLLNKCIDFAPRNKEDRFNGALPAVAPPTLAPSDNVINLRPGVISYLRHLGVRTCRFYQHLMPTASLFGLALFRPYGPFGAGAFRQIRAADCDVNLCKG